jgi:hypothetical protein
VLGPAPFAAFLQYHLPRLGDGSAFAFGTAWPEVAPLLVAANQGVQGMLHKLWAMGVGGEDASLARAASVSYAGLLLALGAATGLRLRRAGRAERAIAWLGLLGMGSLASAGAWADYVPLTCVWLLALLAPQAAGRPAVGTALAICAVFQALLLGTMPIGDRFDAGWMIPLSLLGSAAMLATFVAPVARMALGTLPRALTRPAHAESEA